MITQPDHKFFAGLNLQHLDHIKRELYNHCREYLQKRIEAAQQAMKAAQNSANEETKSSSGDKYETGRAMMQLEIEKNAGQLSESLKLKHALDQINPDQTPDVVQSGTLVITDRGLFFIAISLGKVVLHNQAYSFTRLADWTETTRIETRR